MTATNLFVSGHQGTLGDCDLCLQPTAELTDSVSIRDDRGRLTVFAACERCGRALRRVAAVIGPNSTSITAEVTPTVVLPVPEKESPAIGGEPQLIQEFVEQVVVSDHQYRPRVYACLRTDGTWAAWLVFADESTSEMRSTDIETTQPHLAAVRYWASGLEPIYLEGAFARARTVNVTVPPALLQR
jgi:hypothetical protein